jgi:hypothetical protein
MHGVNSTMSAPTTTAGFWGRNRVSTNATTGTTRKFVASAAAMNRRFRNARRMRTNGISRNVTYSNTARTGLMSGSSAESAPGTPRPTPTASRTAAAYTRTWLWRSHRLERRVIGRRTPAQAAGPAALGAGARSLVESVLDGGGGRFDGRLVARV